MEEYGGCALRYPRLRLRRLWQLFNYTSAAAGCRDGDRICPLTGLWRDKLLQSSWLRALQGRHADFWQVTGDALDFALKTLGLDDPPPRARLTDLYRTLDVFAEVPAMLKRLKASGLKTAILLNGSPGMLVAAVNEAGIGDLLDAVLSVELAGVYEPHPKVYQLNVDRLAIRPWRSRFSLRTPGTLPPPRRSACASCGAAAIASAGTTAGKAGSRDRFARGLPGLIAA